MALNYLIPTKDNLHTFGNYYASNGAITNTVQSVAVTAASDASKSVFKKMLGTMLEGVLAAAGASLAASMFDMITGTPSDPDLEMLNNISNQITALGNAISGLPQAVSYKLTYKAVQDKITGINQLFRAEDVKSLTSDELHMLINFLSPGIGGDQYTDYRSCISNLLRAAYGVTMEDFDAAQGQLVTLGTSQDCQANNMNAQALGSPTGFNDYIQGHLNISTLLIGVITSVIIAAVKVYGFLASEDNQAVLFDKYPDLKNSIQTRLGNHTVISDLCNPGSQNSLANILGQSLMEAPCGLVGRAVFHLYSAMVFNTTPESSNNSINCNVVIQHYGDGFVSTKDPENGYYTLQYISDQNSATKWFLSFAKGTVSNIVNVAGPHGGFLALLPTITNSYAYELIEAKIPGQPSISIPNFAFALWTLMVNGNGNGGFNFIFRSVGGGGELALANNHAWLEDTQPGNYDYGDGGNPDIQWQLTYHDLH